MYGVPVFSMSDNDKNNFCPRCMNVSKWTDAGAVKICQTCGLQVVQAKKLAEDHAGALTQETE